MHAHAASHFRAERLPFRLLPGSFFCWDTASCQQRASSLPWLTGSGSWASSMAQGGIFSDNLDQSSFADANLVYVKYCRSVQTLSPGPDHPRQLAGSPLLNPCPRRAAPTSGLVTCPPAPPPSAMSSAAAASSPPS